MFNDFAGLCLFGRLVSRVRITLANLVRVKHPSLQRYGTVVRHTLGRNYFMGTISADLEQQQVLERGRQQEVLEEIRLHVVRMHALMQHRNIHVRRVHHDF
jgi:hypothetical protein